jgi:hypothetical protein
LTVPRKYERSVALYLDREPLPGGGGERPAVDSAVTREAAVLVDEADRTLDAVVFDVRGSASVSPEIPGPAGGQRTLPPP